MARTDQFTGLTEFLAVAQCMSFRAAGADLGVSSSAVSQAVRGLEARIGVPLFQRTTRNVALTEAGASLLAQLSPAVQSVGEALDNVGSLSSRPSGTLRLSVPRIACELVLWDALPAFNAAHPEIAVDLDVNDAAVDITSGQFDAGIRMGDYIERDMVAVRLTDDFQCVVVGSPSYFDLHGRPASPKNLLDHKCIRYRFPTARSLYRWEFVTGKRIYSVEPQGPVVLNDHLGMIEIARRGGGLVYTLDLVARSLLASGALEAVLSRYLPVTPGLFLYFASRSQVQPKLRAFINFMTKRTRASTPRFAMESTQPKRRRLGRQAHLPLSAD